MDSSTLAPPPYPGFTRTEFAAPAPPKRSLTKLDAPPSLYVTALLACVSVVIGIAADLLFRETSRLGVNAFLFALAGSLAAYGLSKAAKRTLPARSAVCLGVAVFFAACISWRSAQSLVDLNTGIALFLAMLALAPATSHGSVKPGIGLATTAARQCGANLIVGSARFGTEAPWRAMFALVRLGGLYNVLRGLVLAAPLLFIFGTLFSFADARFESVARRLLHLPEDLISHIVWVLTWTWLACGALRMAALIAAPAQVKSQPTRSMQLGGTEALVCLALLDALFLVFVLCQAEYFFGGAAHVSSASGLTMAQYARRGFFELATAAALVLPLLLWADWLLEPETSEGKRRTFRTLCIVLVLLVGLVMTSAMHRMYLYMNSYGLTELRVYVSAFMLMLAAVFAWLCLTVFRGQREKFFAGAVAIGCGSALVLQCVNPHAFIAAHNVRIQGFDQLYLSRLSSDAVPVLSQAAVSNAEAGAVLKQMRLRVTKEAATTWREWNWSRAKASQYLREVAADRAAQP